jgi:hypothetical protein
VIQRGEECDPADHLKLSSLPGCGTVHEYVLAGRWGLLAHPSRPYGCAKTGVRLSHRRAACQWIAALTLAVISG